MKNALSIVMLTGLLGLAACGEQASPSAPVPGAGIPDASTPALVDALSKTPSVAELETQRIEMVKSNIASLERIKIAIEKGELVVPLTIDGKPLDFAAELATMKQSLTDSKYSMQSMVGGGGLRAQRVADETTYGIIADLQESTFTHFLPEYKHTFPGFVWWTDGCSMPGFWPPNEYYAGFFRLSCIHHDFAYHNVWKFPHLRNQLPWVLDPAKLKDPFRIYVDGVFLRDMINQCIPHPISCDNMAAVFYSGVRASGNNSPFYSYTETNHGPR